MSEETFWSFDAKGEYRVEWRTMGGWQGIGVGRYLLTREATLTFCRNRWPEYEFRLVCPGPRVVVSV